MSGLQTKHNYTLLLPEHHKQDDQLHKLYSLVLYTLFYKSNFTHNSGLDAQKACGSYRILQQCQVTVIQISTNIHGLCLFSAQSSIYYHLQQNPANHQPKRNHTCSCQYYFNCISPLRIHRQVKGTKEKLN